MPCANHIQAVFMITFLAMAVAYITVYLTYTGSSVDTISEDPYFQQEQNSGGPSNIDPIYESSYFSHSSVSSVFSFFKPYWRGLSRVFTGQGWRGRGSAIPALHAGHYTSIAQPNTMAHLLIHFLDKIGRLQFLSIFTHTLHSRGGGLRHDANTGSSRLSYMLRYHRRSLKVGK